MRERERERERERADKMLDSQTDTQDGIRGGGVELGIGKKAIKICAKLGLVGWPVAGRLLPSQPPWLERA